MTRPTTEQAELWGLRPEIVAELGSRLSGFWERFAECVTTKTRDTQVYGFAYLSGLLRIDRPDPMTHWEIDFSEVTTVPPDPDGKKQHAVEMFNVADRGTLGIFAYSPEKPHGMIQNT